MSILAILAVLTVIVNIITEVIKKVFSEFKAINLFVVALSVALTYIAMFIYCEYVTFVPPYWYYFIIPLIMGLMVSYSAMFGFDKLKQAVEQMKTYLQDDEDGGGKND